MKKRVKTLLVLFILGLAYLIFIRISGVCIPCFFEKITGWRCPGCGITTLFYRLSIFDFKTAFRANMFLFVTWPFIAFEVIYDFILSLRKKKMPRANSVALYVYIGLLVAWGVVRNLTGV